MVAHCPLHLLHLDTACPGPCYKNNIPAAVYICTYPTVCRADYAARTIAADCIANLFGGGDADTASIVPAPHDVGHKYGRRFAFATIVQSAKILIFLYGLTIHKTIPLVVINKREIFCPLHGGGLIPFCRSW